jgi:hypothetical protein
MFAKKVAIFLVLLSSLAVTSLAGYFTGMRYSRDIAKNEVNAKDVKVSIAVDTVEQPKPPSIVIGTSTQIVKKHKYIKGLEYTKEINEKAGLEILGMDIKTAEKHFKDKGYIIIDFKSEKVTLSKDIDSWAPEVYVVKSDDDVMTIYKSDANGQLTKLQDTEITLDLLPEHDRLEIIKGKTFETLEEAESLAEEYGS